MATVTKLRRDTGSSTRAASRKAPRAARTARRRTRRVARKASRNAENIGRIVLFGSLILVGVAVAAGIAALAFGEEYPSVRRELESYGLPGRLPEPAREVLASLPSTSAHALSRLRDEVMRLQDVVRHYIGR